MPNNKIKNYRSAKQIELLCDLTIISQGMASKLYLSGLCSSCTLSIYHHPAQNIFHIPPSTISRVFFILQVLFFKRTATQMALGSSRNALFSHPSKRVPGTLFDRGPACRFALLVGVLLVLAFHGSLGLGFALGRRLCFSLGSRLRSRSSLGFSFGFGLPLRCRRLLRVFGLGRLLLHGRLGADAVLAVLVGRHGQGSKPRARTVVANASWPGCAAWIACQ